MQLSQRLLSATLRYDTDRKIAKKLARLWCFWCPTNQSIKSTWLSFVKVHSSSSHLMILGKQKVVAKINYNEIKSQNLEELLGTHIDFTLTLENYIDKICKKASQKLNTLAKISPYIRRTIVMCKLHLNCCKSFYIAF